MLGLYKFITNASKPALKQLIQYRLNNGKECPDRYLEKLADTSFKKPPGNLIWVHGASIGEAQSALILIKRLSEIYPSLNIMMTTGTLTSAKVMSNKLPPNAFHQFYPLDHPEWVEKFLEYWQPQSIIWMESELWPNMLSSIKKRHIPTILVNARMSAKSYKSWKKFPKSAKEVLSTFTKILCQTREDKEHFTNLNAKNIIITDNLKYAATPLKSDSNALKTLIKHLGDRPLWLYASTHEGEEKIACDIHQKLKKTYPNLLTIIVPRHPERRNQIIEIFAQYETLKCELRSTQKEKHPSPDTDIYLADTLGELGLFYRLCPITCIGRTFSNDGGGGHNPIEAIQLGCVVLHGPNVQNLQNIFDEMNSHHISFSLGTPNALQDKLYNLLYDRQKLEGLQKKSVIYSRQKINIVEKVLNEINPILNQAGITQSKSNCKRQGLEKHAV